MSNIDEKIKEFLAVVEKQKKEVDIAKKESERKWKTNAAFEASVGNVVNLQTANKEQIIKVVITLMQYKTARQEALEILELNIPNDTFSGYSYDAWIDDCKKRIAVVELQDKIKKLNELEQRLNSIVSPEQRRQFELEAISKDLLG